MRIGGLGCYSTRCNYHLHGFRMKNMYREYFSKSYICFLFSLPFLFVQHNLQQCTTHSKCTHLCICTTLNEFIQYAFTLCNVVLVSDCSLFFLFFAFVSKEYESISSHQGRSAGQMGSVKKSDWLVQVTDDEGFAFE